MKRAIPLIVLFVISCVFVAGRTVPAWNTVFPEDSDHTMLLGVDSYFHLRHAEYSESDFPNHLRLDPGAHYPSVEHQQYSGLYNLGLAAVARGVRFVTGEPANLAAIAAYSPVFLALATLLLLFVLLKDLFGDWWGLGGAALFTFHSGFNLAKTTLGFADQHALEVFLAIGVLWGLNRALRLRHPISSVRFWLQMVTCALPLAALPFSWIGYPLFMVITSVYVVVVLLGDLIHDHSESDPAARPGRQLAAFLLCSVLLIVVTTWLFPEWKMELVGNMYRWTLIGLMLLAVLSVLIDFLKDRFLEDASASKRVGSTVALFVLLTIVGWLFINYHPKGGEFWYWLTFERGQDVAEQQAVTVPGVFTMYGLSAALALMAVAALVVALIRRRVPPEVLASGAFSIVCVWIWIGTNDFDYLPAPFLACLGIIGLAQIESLPKPEPLRSLFARATLKDFSLLMSLIVALGMLTGSFGRVPWIKKSEVDVLLFFDESWFDAMDWLRHSTPSPPVLPIDQVTKTEPWPASNYGVMAAWDHGNFVSAVGHRSTRFSRYPSSGGGIWMTDTSESDAMESLCPECQGEESVRYAVLGHDLASDLFLSKLHSAGREAIMQQEGLWNHQGQEVPHITFGDPFEKALVTRLYRNNGSGLKHHRIVFESEQRYLNQMVYDPSLPELRLTSDLLPPGVAPPLAGNLVLTEVNGLFIYDVYPAPAVRIIEIVSGARLHGTASPGEEIRVLADIMDSIGLRHYTYEQYAISDSLGRFEIILPYATGPNPLLTKLDDQPLRYGYSDFKAVGAWTIVSSGGRQTSLGISQDMVVSGDSVEIRW